jgi:hypothetical protein
MSLLRAMPFVTCKMSGSSPSDGGLRATNFTGMRVGDEVSARGEHASVRTIPRRLAGESRGTQRLGRGRSRRTAVPAVETLAVRTQGDKSTRGILAVVEAALKKPVFGCHMCGQCVLHSTGLTCPMNCPKTLRNGPCGGVRPDGHCEVKPEMLCVWVKAVERSRRLPWAQEIDDIRRPVDNRLFGTSSWINLLTKRDSSSPKGWDVPA